MLYKKIHRQFLRECRIGRKYKRCSSNVVDVVTGKPHIDSDFNSILADGWNVITIKGQDSGKIWNRSIFNWQED